MNLCIIPARGGSKRIPKKNIKLFHGKPIIGYSIEAALQSNCFDRVIVSTDDKQIAEVAQSYGAEIPFQRPVELSNDYTATLPVINHAIDWLSQNEKVEPENVCCIYATAPFISVQTIKNSLALMKNEAADYCFTATRYSFPIQRAIKLTHNRVDMFYPENFNTRSQDLEEAYHDAGQLYWGKSEAFNYQIPMFSKRSVAYVLSSHLVQDIDTVDDWIRAELMYKALIDSGELG